jgi:hypothetical protein
MFDPRWGEDPRDCDDNLRAVSRGSRGGSEPRAGERVDPRDGFMEHVGLPRGLALSRPAARRGHRPVLQVGSIRGSPRLVASHKPL